MSGGQHRLELIRLATATFKMTIQHVDLKRTVEQRNDKKEETLRKCKTCFHNFSYVFCI